MRCAAAVQRPPLEEVIRPGGERQTQQALRSRCAAHVPASRRHGNHEVHYIASRRPQARTSRTRTMPRESAAMPPVTRRVRQRGSEARPGYAAAISITHPRGARCGQRTCSASAMIFRRCHAARQAAPRPTGRPFSDAPPVDAPPALPRLQSFSPPRADADARDAFCQCEQPGVQTAAAAIRQFSGACHVRQLTAASLPHVVQRWHDSSPVGMATHENAGCRKTAVVFSRQNGNDSFTVHGRR